MDRVTQPDQNPHVPLPAHARRVGDSERHQVAEVLREAAGDGYLDLEELQERLDATFAAKTRADLVPLVQDLPERGEQPVAFTPVAPAPPRPSGVVDRVGGAPTSTNAIAVMSGSDRKGPWVMPTTFTAVAVMGGVLIDLTHARLEGRDSTIHAYAWMGGIDIVVPEDVAVVVDGYGFMGAFDENMRGVPPPPPGSPVVRVKGLAMMGGVTVQRPKPKRKRRLMGGSAS